MIRNLLRRRYLLIQSDGLTRLIAPVGRYWLRASATHAQAMQALQRASEGHHPDRYSYRVVSR